MRNLIQSLLLYKKLFFHFMKRRKRLCEGYFKSGITDFIEKVGTSAFSFYRNIRRKNFSSRIDMALWGVVK